MGNSFSFSFLTNLPEVRVLMVGLDCAGKTTILYKLRLAEGVSTIPTIGFNTEIIEYKQFKFIALDIGGQDEIRPSWKHYSTNTNCIIFVIDSNDRERLGEASKEIRKLLRVESLREKPLLVFANKQDLPAAMAVEDISHKLELHSIRDRKWMIQPCSAPSGDGVFEGLAWLSSVIS